MLIHLIHVQCHRFPALRRLQNSETSGGAKLRPSHFPTHCRSSYEICARVHPFHPGALGVKLSASFSIFQHLSARLQMSQLGLKNDQVPFHPRGLSSFSTAFGWFWCSSEDHIRLAFAQEFPQWLEAGSESPAFFPQG